MASYINETNSLPGSMLMTRGKQNLNGSGFIYKIMPLKTNFVRKPDDINVVKIPAKFFKPGDHVKGKSVEDNKWYVGKISRIKTNSKGEKLIAYIQKDSDNIIIPVSFKSLKYTDQSKYNYNTDTVTENIDIQKINNIINDNYSMNTHIKRLILEYFEDQNTQLKNLLKDCDKAQKKYDKLSGPRKEFIINILGKNTYKKYATGEFAPVPLSAMALTINDIAKLSKETKKNLEDDRLKLFISELKKYYHSNDLNLVNNGVTLSLQTNIVFQKLDDIIDFFFNIFKTYKKVYKNEDIDWTILVKKFRNYLK